MGIAQSAKCDPSGRVFGLWQQHKIFARDFWIHFRKINDDESEITDYIQQNRTSMVHNPMQAPEPVTDLNGWTHLPCGGFELSNAPNQCIEIFPVYSYIRLASGSYESRLRHYVFTTHNVNNSPLTIPVSRDPPPGLFTQTMESILTQPHPVSLSRDQRDAWEYRKEFSWDKPTEMRFSQLRAEDGRLY